MSFWAFSELSQKFGNAIWELSLSRSNRLAAMSKRVSELGQAGQEFRGSAMQFDIHESPQGLVTAAEMAAHPYY